MATMTKPIRFRLSVTVFFALGLDDSGLVADAYPSFRVHHDNMYEVDRGDAVAMLDAITDRMTPEGGYEHTASERRALRTAAIAIRAAIQSAAEG